MKTTGRDVLPLINDTTNQKDRVAETNPSVNLP